MVEFWRGGGPRIPKLAQTARAVEAAGWDGQMFMDSQSLNGDPYVMMGHWAALTERLMLCTGVTNPLTRHPAVTAAAMATLQGVSGGRAVLGIGRGDSALAFLGHAPAPLPVFERALQDLQALLGGGEVAFDAAGLCGEAPSVATLSLGHRPSAARLNWLPEGLPKVPLDVAATGPKVIALSAPIAERVTFSVGAISERVAWALDIARTARAARGLGDEGVSYGVQIILVCHRDIEAIRETATRFTAPLARFQVIQGEAAGPLSVGDAENFAAIRKGYDMAEHGESHHAVLVGTSLSFDFVRRFAIVGTPDHCIERLLALSALGVERFVVVGPGFYDDGSSDGQSLFTTEVMPAVRTALG